MSAIPDEKVDWTPEQIEQLKKDADAMKGVNKPEPKFKREKRIVYKKRMAPKGHAFFIVSHVHKKLNKRFELSLCLDCKGKTDIAEELLFTKMEVEMEEQLKKLESHATD